VPMKRWDSPPRIGIRREQQQALNEDRVWIDLSFYIQCRHGFVRDARNKGTYGNE